MADQIPRATVPANIDTPDTIACGLTFRQLAIMSTVATAAWMLYSRFSSLLPPLVWLIAAIPLTAVTVVVALGRRDGLPLDVWLRHGVTFQRTPRVYTPGCIPSGPPLLTQVSAPRTPAPLRSEVTSIAPDGTLTVNTTARRLIGCGTTTIELRTGKEQAALLDGFGQWLNALTSPAQIVVTAQRHDLTPYAEAIVRASHALPQEALRRAAEDYAAFLVELDEQRDPLRRQVITVVSAGPACETTLRAFTAIGVNAEALDGGCVVAALAETADPYCPPVPGRRALPDSPITIRRA